MTNDGVDMSAVIVCAHTGQAPHNHLWQGSRSWTNEADCKFATLAGKHRWSESTPCHHLHEAQPQRNTDYLVRQSTVRCARAVIPFSETKKQNEIRQNTKKQ